MKCYNVYFVNEYVFHTKEYEKGRKTYNNGFYVKGSTSSEFEVDYYGKLEEVIELQYHNEYNRVFLFKCYWYDTTNKEIIVDSHHGLVEISSKARLGNVNDVFVFTKQRRQVYYTYTPFFGKNCLKVDWLSILKTKPKGRVEVVQDENDDSNVGDDVFQVRELVEPYRVAPYWLRRNSNFRIFYNIFVDVDVEELNVVLSSNGEAQVDEDDGSNDINVKDCNRADDESIEEEEDNSD